MKKCFLFLIIILCGTLQAQEAADLRRSGDEAYDSGVFQKAEEDYRAADSKDPSFKSTYNLGNTLYQQQKLEEAEERYLSALSKAKTDGEKSRAYYNLGNTAAKKGDLDAALDAYRNSLKFDPNDDEASYNYARTLLNQKMQQQQKQHQSGGEKDQQNKDQQEQEQQEQQNQENQQNQDQEQQEKDQQEQQQDQEEQDNNSEQQNSENQDQSQEGEQQEGAQQEGAENGKMSKEEAKRLLEIMKEQEQKTQEKLQRGSGKKIRPKKDW